MCIRDSIDTLENKPIDFLMTVAPIWKAGKAGVPSSVATKLDSLKNTIKTATENVTPEVIKQSTASVKQIVSDSFKTSEPSTSAFIEQTIKTPEAAAASIKDASVRMAKESPDVIKPEKPITANLDITKNKPDDLVTISLDGKNIDVKNKYLQSIDQEGFNNIDTTSEVGRKAFDAYVQKVGLENDIVSIKEQLIPELKNIKDLNKYIDLYDRLLNENVDAPTKTMVDFIRTADIGKGKKPTITQAELFSEYVKSLNDIKNLDTQVEAILSDRVVAPARTKDFYTVSPDGKLVKGAERIQDVEKAYSERLERETPEAQRDILTAEQNKELFPSKTEGAVQRLEQQKVKEVGRREPIDYLVKNETYNKALKEIAKDVLDSYPDGDTTITSQRLASRFAFALDEQLSKGLLLLRSPDFKRSVLKDVAKELKDTGWTNTEIKNIIKQLDEDVFRKAVTENNTGKIRDFVIQKDFPSKEFSVTRNPIIFDGDMLQEIILKKDNAKLIDEAKKKAITDLGDEIAQETQYLQTRQMIKAESERFMKDKSGKLINDVVRNPEVYAVQVLNRVIGNGEALPILVPFEGKKLANAIKAMRENVADKIVELNPNLNRNKVLTQIDSIADRFDRMEKFDLSIADTLLPQESLVQFKKVGPDNTIFDNIYTLPEVGNAYKWEFLSRAAMQNPTNGLGFFQIAKRNLTARSLPSIKNNFLSNILSSTIKSGNPLLIKDIVETSYKYYDYKKNNDIKLSPIEKRSFDAIDKSGLFNTTELVRDIGTTKVSEGSNAVVRGYQKGMANLEGLYSKLGDIPFKLEEATRSYKKIETSMDLLDQGEYIISPISKNASVKVTKVGNQYKVQLIDNKGKTVVNTKDVKGTIDNPDISRLLGRAAAFEANKLFFDYSDVGNFNKVLRTYPILNAISGFYTWYNKSLDIPFVKKGLLGETLFPTEYIASNSPKVIQKNINMASEQALRKALVINAARGSLIQNTGRNQEQKAILDLAKKSLAFSAKDADTLIIGPLLDPSYVYYNDYTNQIPFKATDILSKLGSKALVSAFGFATGEDYERKLFPLLQEDKELDYDEFKKEQKRLGYFLKDLRGENFSAKDIMSLVGLGGNAIFTMLDKVADTETQGNVLDYNKMGQDFLGAAIGKTPATLLLNTAGYVGTKIPGTIGETLTNISPYGKEQKKFGFSSGEIAPDVQPMVQYLVAQVLGQGWKKTSLLGEKENVITGGTVKNRFEYYLTGADKELQANLIRPLELKAQQSLALSESTEDPELKKQYEERAYYYMANVDYIKELIDSILDEERAIMYNIYDVFK